MLRSTIALLLLACVCSSAHAGAFLCDSHWLSHIDERQLEAVVKSTAPGIHFDAEQSYCRHSHFARAWLESKHRFVPDHIEEWWSIHCARTHRTWECDAPTQHRITDITHTFAGVTQRVTIKFDQHTPPDRARAITRLAIDTLSSDTGPLPTCNSPKSEQDAQEWRKVQETFRLGAGVEPLEVEVTTEDSKTEVWIPDRGSVSLDFAPGGVDSPPAAECWGILVIVA